MVDDRGLVPLEYQEAMRDHWATLRRLDAAIQGDAPRRWTPEQAQEARALLTVAHEAFMETCERVAAQMAALPVEERRTLLAEVKAELDSYDKINRTIVEVTGLWDSSWTFVRVL